MASEKKNWSYLTGRVGVNRIRVYERDKGASIYVEWYDRDGRHAKALKSVVGEAVTDRELAKDIADRMAERQLRKTNADARALVFPDEQPDRMLGELLERYHDDKWDDWGEWHRRKQKRFRRFWTDSLGKSTGLRQVSAAVVEQTVRNAGKGRWKTSTRNHYKRYLVDAFYYAERKLKWISPRDNLSAVDFPSAETRSLAYSLDEVRRLLPKLEEVDERAGFVGQVAWQTGRRLSAIRTLPRSAFTVEVVEDEEGREVEVGVIRFPGETDKARRSGKAVVVGRGLALGKTLAARGGPHLTPADSGGPIRQETLNDMLHEAEKEAEIEHVHGRAWHGIKRRFATTAQGWVGRGKQAGTLEETLDRIYVQDDLAPKVELAGQLARQVAGE